MEIIRIAIAIAIGVTVFMAGRWGVRLLATPQPPDPDPSEIVDVEAPYRCTVCGMRLTVTHAQGEDITPPRHCREEMEPA